MLIPHLQVFQHLCHCSSSH
uniref:Uncharacterized protein n=1 Tax=Rhizophora mucronata TaxID=61149 RepID=A0A2P2NUH2_RHIMU